MTSLTRELIIFVVAIILFGFFMYFVVTPRLLKLLNKFGDLFVCPLYGESIGILGGWRLSHHK